MFTHLKLEGWRQFGNVEITFHDRLTVLTGANGSGKTTLLNTLGNHFGWNVPLVRGSFRSKREVVREFLEHHWEDSGPELNVPHAPPNTVGAIRYDDRQVAYLVEPQDENIQFTLQTVNARPIRGIHIPSHRPVPGRAAVTDIPTAPPTKAKAVANYQREVLNRYLGNRSAQTPGYVLKQTIMSLCIVTSRGERLRGTDDELDTIEGFEAVLRSVLPESFGFERFEVELPELYLETSTERIPFDAISGGIASLIDMAYQIYMYSPVNQSYVVVIDEPENHLHPAMQKQFLPNVTSAFPMVQFVVATHSPFIIGSVSDSRVYALVHDDGKVFSRYLNMGTKAGTAEDILKDVLGLESTLPIWVERAMSRIVDKYMGQSLTPARVSALREEMLAAGLRGQVTDALTEFAKHGER